MESQSTNGALLESCQVVDTGVSKKTTSNILSVALIT